MIHESLQPFIVLDRFVKFVLDSLRESRQSVSRFEWRDSRHACIFLACLPLAVFGYILLHPQYKRFQPPQAQLQRKHRIHFAGRMKQVDVCAHGLVVAIDLLRRH